MIGMAPRVASTENNPLLIARIDSPIPSSVKSERLYAKYLP
jgi:hypothetical protein